jgi:hypothetical protein
MHKASWTPVKKLILATTITMNKSSHSARRNPTAAYMSASSGSGEANGREGDRDDG